MNASAHDEAQTVRADVFNVQATIGWVHLIAAIIAAKWAAELGCGQVRQLLWMIAGFICPPLALLVLYVRLVRRGQEARERASAVC